MLSLRVVVPLALAVEPAGREGVAAMTARLLDEGTAQHGPEEFAELMERHGMALGAGVSDGGLLVDVDVPQSHLATASELVAQALAEPVFPEARSAGSSATGWPRSSRSGPPSAHRALRELTRTLWDPAERAATPAAGTPETIGALTREDVVDFHRRRVGPQGATVVLAGDLSADPDRCLRALDASPGPLGQRGARAVASAGRRRGPRATGCAPSSSTARVQCRARSRSAVPGPDRSTPHGWAPHPVISFVLGGSPTARVDAVLREEKGYTYGIRTSFRPRVAGGTFVAQGSVRSEVTAEATDLLLGILDGARDGFTDDELRSGTDFVARTAPGRYATADAIADESAGLAMEGLPVDFTTQNLRAVATLTREDLDEAYRRTATGEWSVVVVGDAEQVVPALEAALPGPVETRCPLSRARGTRSSSGHRSGASSCVEHSGALVAIGFDAPADGTPGRLRGGSPVLAAAHGASSPSTSRASVGCSTCRCARSGTEFQRRVWDVLATVPWGTTTTYGAIAARLGLPPGASRAVGAANGANPLPVVLPCHRVVGSDGRLTGYAGGLARKARCCGSRGCGPRPTRRPCSDPWVSRRGVTSPRPGAVCPGRGGRAPRRGAGRWWRGRCRRRVRRRRPAR